MRPIQVQGLILARTAMFLTAAEWSAPVQVLHDFKPAVTYRAKAEGGYLIVEAAVEPGWHTFTMDNDRRAAEKLAGKMSLGGDQPTKITAVAGLQFEGPWYQTAPLDFSKPEMRWFSWGFEKQALFVTKARRSGSGPARIGIRGQACTDKTCKNIDVEVAVPLDTAAGASKPDLSKLVQVR